MFGKTKVGLAGGVEKEKNEETRVEEVQSTNNNQYNISNSLLGNWKRHVVKYEYVRDENGKHEHHLRLELDDTIDDNIIKYLTDSSRSARPLFFIKNSKEIDGFYIALSVDKNYVNCACSSLDPEGNKIWNERFTIHHNPLTFGEENWRVAEKDASGGDTASIDVILAPPLIFHCRVTVFSIDSIDTVDQKFQTYFYCENRLRGIVSNEDESMVTALLKSYIVDESSIDFLSVAEMISDRVIETAFANSIAKGMKDYLFKMKMKAVFSEMMEVQKFPWDMEDLNICLTFNTSITRVILRPNDEYPSVLLYKNFQLASVYDTLLKDCVLAYDKVSDKSESSAGTIYPRCNFVILLQRKAGYYIYNVCLPLAVLTLLGPASCFIEADGTSMGTADRLSVTLTLLLTAVAYKFVVASSLPQVSYQTLLDFYVLVCFFLLVVNVVENVVYPIFEFHHASKRSEWIFVIVYYVIVALFNVAAYLYVQYTLGSKLHRAKQLYMKERASRYINQTWEYMNLPKAKRVGMIHDILHSLQIDPSITLEDIGEKGKGGSKGHRHQEELNDLEKDILLIKNTLSRSSK